MRLPNFPERLDLEDSAYRAFLDGYMQLFAGADKSFVDSSKFLLPEVESKYSLLTNTSGVVVAGIDDCAYLLNSVGLICEVNVKDGDKVAVGDKLMEIIGMPYNVLEMERFVLDLMVRMSGIATNTYNFRQKLASDEIFVAATRKTVLPLIDKKAVVIGGGISHRLNLKDAVILKDNHKSPTLIAALKKMHSMDLSDLDFFEVEIESADELFDFEKFLDEFSVPTQIGLMLDNFLPSEIDKLNDRLLFLKEKFDLFIEVSGGVDLKNISEYKSSAIDFISSSQLTMYPYPVDFSLELERK